MCGERLKHYRTVRKMSQEELAESMGFPPNTISKIEHGTRKVTLEEAVRFAEVLHISLLDLAGVPEGTSQREVLHIKVGQCAQKMREAARLADDLAETLASELVELPSLQWHKAELEHQA